MADPAVDTPPADPAPPAVLAEQFKSITLAVQQANDRVAAALDQQKRDIELTGETTRETKKALDDATKSFVQVQDDLKGVAQKCADLGTRLDTLELDAKEGRFGTKAADAPPPREDVASQLYAQLASSSTYMARIKSGERVAFEIDDIREDRKATVMTDAATRLVVPDRKPIVMPDRQPVRVADLFSQDSLQGISLEYLRYLGMGPNGGTAVTSITRSTTTATVTTTAAHGFTSGDLVQIQGATQTEYNVSAYITVTGSTTFTYTVAGSPATPATTTTAIAALNLYNHGGAVPLGEGVAAPEAAASFTLETAKLKEVAHQIPITLLALENVAGLRSVLDNELLFGLDLMVDRALLYATGSDSANAPQLQGILTAPNIQTYSWSAGANAAANTVGDTMLDAIRRAQTRLEIWGRLASALIINPFDKEKIDLVKTTTGEYIWSDISTGPGRTVWLTPVVSTPSIAVGTAAIGDFKAAATLYSKKAGQVYVGTINTQFIQRMLTLMAVWQGLLAVQRPRAIVKITFDNAPA